MPPKVNCLALIPSLAASLGFGCGGGGLIKAEAYELVGELCFITGVEVGGNTNLVSTCLIQVSIFFFCVIKKFLNVGELIELTVKCFFYS